MKKLLGISLVAVLAATPLMANAANELASGVQIHGGVTVSNAENGGNALATKSYVQGAYNTVETDIANVNNAVTLLNNNAETAGSVLNAVKTQAAYGDYNASTDYTAGTIGYAIKNTSAAAVGALDATESQTGDANNGQLNLSITQADGVITSISGSITPNTYDAYGSAAAEQTRATGVEASLAQDIADEETRAKGVEGSLSSLTGNAFGATSLVGAINAVDDAVSTLTTNANSTYQQKTDSTVADGTYAHITQGNGVGANLVSLNGAVVANDGAIATINNKQIPIVSDWSTGTVSNTKISELETYVQQ